MNAKDRKIHNDGIAHGRDLQRADSRKSHQEGIEHGRELQRAEDRAVIDGLTAQLNRALSENLMLRDAKRKSA